MSQKEALTARVYFANSGSFLSEGPYRVTTHSQAAAMGLCAIELIILRAETAESRQKARIIAPGAGVNRSAALGLGGSGVRSPPIPAHA
jgi:hypothetical protein